MNAQENVADMIFHKDRSFKACMADAWKAFALHHKDFLKFLWPSLLFAGASFALLSFVLLHFFNQCLVPARLFLQSGFDPQLVSFLFRPSVGFWVKLFLSLLVAVAGYGAWMGCTVSQIRMVRASGSLPASSCWPFRREIYRDGGRSVLAGLVMLAGNLALFALGAWAGLKWSWWSLVAVVPVLVYWNVTGIMATTSCLVERTPLLAAWKMAFRHGMRRFGGIFLIALLTFIPIALVAMMAGLPALILQLSYAAETAALLAGDAVETPSYIPLLYLLTNLVVIAFILFNLTLQFWAFALRMSAGQGSPAQEP